jgi:hypothetical protein
MSFVSLVRDSVICLFLKLAFVSSTDNYVLNTVPFI